MELSGLCPEQRNEPICFDLEFFPKIAKKTLTVSVWITSGADTIKQLTPSNYKICLARYVN